MGVTLYNMLVILLANYYETVNIFQANQNNFVLPKNGKWVIITEQPTAMISYPVETFIGALPQGTRTIENLGSTTFQLDFYSQELGIAEKCADWTRLYIQSASGSNYLAAAGNMTVHKIEPMNNLTGLFDERKYLERFNFKFSVFNNITIGWDEYAFDARDVKPEIIKVS